MNRGRGVSHQAFDACMIALCQQFLCHVNHIRELCAKGARGTVVFLHPRGILKCDFRHLRLPCEFLVQRALPQPFVHGIERQSDTEESADCSAQTNKESRMSPQLIER